MAKFIIRRSLRTLLTLWIVVSIVFLVFRLAGDPLTVLLPESAPQSVRDFYIEKWGLDAPLMEQYARYFLNVLQGNLGQSFTSGRDVVDVMAMQLPYTLVLGTSAFLLSLFLGIGAGLIAATHRNSVIDRVVMVTSVVGFSIPNYFLGIVLIILISVHLRLLPTSGSESWRHLILPLITLGVGSAARLARFTRSAVLDVLGEPYLRTAQAKGLPDRTILLRHTLRNATIPIITVAGFQLGYLVGGSAVVEAVFAWPGIGRLLVQSVSLRDLPVVQAVVLLIAVGVTLANLLVDVAYGILDPRIRITG